MTWLESEPFYFVCLYGSSSFYDGDTHIPVWEVSSFCKFSFIRLDFLEIFLFYKFIALFLPQPPKC